MEIHPAIIGASKNETRGSFVISQGEPERRQPADHRFSIVKRDHAIQIVVSSRLHSHERIYAPTTIEPDLKTRLAEVLDDGRDVTGGHHAR